VDGWKGQSVLACGGRPIDRLWASQQPSLVLSYLFRTLTGSALRWFCPQSSSQIALTVLLSDAAQRAATLVRLHTHRKKIKKIVHLICTFSFSPSSCQRPRFSSLPQPSWGQRHDAVRPESHRGGRRQRARRERGRAVRPVLHFLNNNNNNNLSKRMR